MARKFSGLGTGKRADARFKIDVQVRRDVGASTAHAFQASACIMSRRAARRGRCGTGVGSNPTAAAKKALASLARTLKRRG